MDGDLDAVVFDWGDTLVWFPGYTTSRQRHIGCVQALFRELRASGHASCFDEFDDARFLAAYEDAGDRQHRFSRETGREHRLQDRLDATLRAAGCRCPLDDDVLAALVERLAALLVEQTRPVDDAPALLAGLRRRYRIGLVANYPWAPLVRTTLERYDLGRHLDGVVISGELGWVKPHPLPFHRITEALGVEPRRALFVGDDLVNDVRGAKAMGFRTAWLAPGRPPGSEPAADHHLARLSDLRALLLASEPPGA